MKLIDKLCSLDAQKSNRAQNPLLYRQFLGFLCKCVSGSFCILLPAWEPQGTQVCRPLTHTWEAEDSLAPALPLAQQDLSEKRMSE